MTTVLCKVSMAATAVALLVASLTACSAGTSEPGAVAALRGSSESVTAGLPTPTITAPRDAYNEALLSGELGSFRENGKAYFTITTDEGDVVGLIFTPGHDATSDGQTLRWTGERVRNSERVYETLDIAHVGDRVEFSGGEASSEATYWDATETPTSGLWLAVPGIPVQ